MDKLQLNTDNPLFHLKVLIQKKNFKAHLQGGTRTGTLRTDLLVIQSTIKYVMRFQVEDGNMKVCQYNLTHNLAI